MARALAAAGHDVRVYTGDAVVPGRRRRARVPRAPARASSPTARSPSSASRRTPRERAAGAQRIANWLSVAAGIALRVVRRTRRYDAVVVSSPPITLAVPALAGRLRASRAARRGRARRVARHRREDGILARRTSRLARVVGRVADALYARAALIAVVTASARDEVVGARRRRREDRARAQRLRPRRTRAANRRSPRPAGRTRRRVRREHGARDRPRRRPRRGRAAARASDVRFVLIGGGADARAAARARGEREGLRNVVFTGPLPREAALRALADAEVTVVPLLALDRRQHPDEAVRRDGARNANRVERRRRGEGAGRASDAGVAVDAGRCGRPRGGARRMLDDPAARARFGVPNGPAFVARELRPGGGDERVRRGCAPQ